MLADILRIAFLCVVIGCASIPLSFEINNSPWIVWLGNALGSLVSALVVVYIGERITDQKFKQRISRRAWGKKIVKAFDEGNSNEGVSQARNLINKHGLKAFSLFCPIFPGVLLSTAAVYLLDLDKKIYKRSLPAGIFIVSGLYVFGFWWLFIQ